MKTDIITVKTIAAKHVEQLPMEHFWEGEFNWDTVEILGRLAGSGFIVCRNKSDGALRRISPISFIDWQLEKNGCRKRVGNHWEYAPLPHNSYSEAARAELDKIPQLFIG